MLLIIYAVATENYCEGAKKWSRFRFPDGASSIKKLIIFNNLFVYISRAVSWRRLLAVGGSVMTAGEDCRINDRTCGKDVKRSARGVRRHATGERYAITHNPSATAARIIPVAAKNTAPCRQLM
jgi:hypothetical protein